MLLIVALRRQKQANLVCIANPRSGGTIQSDPVSKSIYKVREKEEALDTIGEVETMWQNMDSNKCSE